MLYLSLFLAGFTLGIFAALKIFAPERQEEVWDPQHFPQVTSKRTSVALTPKTLSPPNLPLQVQNEPSFPSPLRATPHT